FPVGDFFPSGGFTVGPDEPVCNRQSLPFASSFMPPVEGISQVLGSIGLTPDEIAMVV
ncbi:MAG: hypothetical protein GWN79_19375, partial [Actinobacteria bacterium]|nr:hypothetical protein [Actinomycetota bacterium]NIS34352.1 hypothetical protein [Actinomycetota bacterium]NIT97425.1 hypothetical protein [Actinomycetota bacterium]NIU21098.1 hypothetical protein [Actinomycetota bacterium]NIU69136.1 hypothetical protein [Actinomycetota bacterium]